MNDPRELLERLHLALLFPWFVSIGGWMICWIIGDITTVFKYFRTWYGSLWICYGMAEPSWTCSAIDLGALPVVAACAGACLWLRRGVAPTAFAMRCV